MTKIETLQDLEVLMHIKAPGFTWASVVVESRVFKQSAINDVKHLKAKEERIRKIKGSRNPETGLFIRDERAGLITTIDYIKHKFNIKRKDLK